MGALCPLEALRWLHFLLARAQDLVLEQVGRLLNPLLDSLSAPSDVVVTSALGVLAAIADCPGQFTPVLVALLDRFRGEAGFALLQRSGSSLVRRLCSHLGAAAVLTEFGAILQRDNDMAFAATMVSPPGAGSLVLNLILLTGPELAELRGQLRSAAVNPAGAQLFSVLYPSWCYSAGALLSLCFVAQAYDHAVEVVHAFADLPFGAELLVQIDRLVALLETPCFTFLRLQLLEPRRHPSLLRALYGLLMLLPQCNAFRMLNTRLQSSPRAPAARHGDPLNCPQHHARHPPMAPLCASMRPSGSSSTGTCPKGILALASG
ncbi:Protein VAC14 [Tetrabaena socialis]|uniref:Protein VAC14 n=1 Tax=Tetrabaena socialis TaxID=47790 RepID=A0A2J7ZYW8_9CHLO|nr:Protein VAC14 [Tetrabaena socialis]|eukprot:PNH05463.1 Protein VAC14 [Tetrabaena socialis]